MDRKSINVAVVGASGLVGRTMVKVLGERNFPVKELTLLASSRSAGQTLKFRNKEVAIKELNENSFNGVDIALFSAGKEVGKKFAPIAVNSGTIVIDNGSYWRMDENVPLVVPEVNPDAAKSHKGIIANPNCSTIQLVVALKPIYKKYGLKRVLVSTYQSVSGAGQKGLNQLMSEIEGKEPSQRISGHQLAYNTVFHGISDVSGFSEEEIKMINETRKIFNNNDLKISVTCVRLPVLGGHGESVNVETEIPCSVEDIRNLFINNPDIVLIDEPIEEKYPTTLNARDKDSVFIGRIRKDSTVENGFHLWVVADNLRKGAATNAVQIAELFTLN